MDIGIYGAALGSLQQEKTMNVIANNLANASTPGFKKDQIHFRDFMSQATHTQIHQGNINATNNPLDVALFGEGFFRVQTDKGVLYTRNGNFNLNNDKVLVTQEGWPVLGQSGPIQFEGTDIRIDQNGQVFDDNESVDVLSIARFQPDAAPRKVRNGYFQVEPDQIQLIESTEYTVQQGALEGANFNVVEEMAQMIETMRIFETYQKVMQTFNQQDSQLLRLLGNL